MIDLIKRVATAIEEEKFAGSFVDFVSYDWLNLAYSVKYMGIAKELYSFEQYIQDGLSSLNEEQKESVISTYAASYMLKNSDYDAWLKSIEKCEWHKATMVDYERLACVKLISSVFYYKLDEYLNGFSAELSSYFKLIGKDVNYGELLGLLSYSKVSTLFSSPRVISDIDVKHKYIKDFALEKDGLVVSDMRIKLANGNVLYAVSLPNSNSTFDFVEFTEEVPSEVLKPDYEKFLSLINWSFSTSNVYIRDYAQMTSFAMFDKVSSSPMFSKMFNAMYFSGYANNIVSEFLADEQNKDIDVDCFNSEIVLFSMNNKSVYYEHSETMFTDNLCRFLDYVTIVFTKKVKDYFVATVYKMLDEKLSLECDEIKDILPSDFEPVLNYIDLLPSGTIESDGCVIFNVGKFKTQNDVLDDATGFSKIYPCYKYKDVILPAFYINTLGDIIHFFKHNEKVYFVKFIGEIGLPEFNLTECVNLKPVEYPKFATENNFGKSNLQL